MIGFVLMVVIVVFTIACGADGTTPAKVDQAKESMTGEKRPTELTTDILKFKVKEEDFGIKGLNLKVNSILVEPFAQSEYKLKIYLDSIGKSNLNYGEYYLVFRIYPKDDEKEILTKARQKYNFESFSLKIKHDKENGLTASRKFQTKVRVARAVTLTAFSYETKQKHMEIVLKNVDFLN